MRDANLYQNKEIYDFGDFTLDVGSGVLSHGKDVVHLPPKSYQLLVHLVRSDGRVVSKEEFFEELWPDTFVEDGSLSYAIFCLRKALSKVDHSQQYVETIARRGFRFLAPVKRRSPEPVASRSDHRITTVVEEVWLDKPSSEVAVPIQFARHSLPQKKSSPFRHAIFVFTCLIGIVFFGTGAWYYSASQTTLKIADIRSIAVLPLQSFDASSDDESLRMRITDSLITRLGSFGSFSVIPTSSIRKWSSIPIDAVEAKKELKVDAVLVGRVQRESGRLRVTVQLISASSDENIWSEQFDGREDRLLDLQDEIASAFFAQLKPRATDSEIALMKKRKTSNNEAYENYLHGRFRFLKRNTEDIEMSKAYFERAIALDPNFVDAKIGLAKAMAFNPIYRERIDSLLIDIDNVDANASEAHCIRGFIQSFHDWDWRTGEKSFETAIRLDPNNSLARQWYGNSLMVRSRFDEAEVQLKKALELDPTSVPIRSDLGQLYLTQQRYEDADDQFAWAVSMQADRAGVHSLLQMSNLARIRSERLAAGNRELSIDESNFLEELNGHAIALRKALRTDQAFYPEFLQNDATISAFKQDREATLVKLRQLAAMQKFYLPFKLLEPSFDFLRNDPEYVDLLHSIGLNS